MFIVTAWNGSEYLVQCPSAAEALSTARDMVAKGKKISIVRTSSGEPIDVNALQDEVKRAEAFKR
jgi:hypothetical protein